MCVCVCVVVGGGGELIAYSYRTCDFFQGGGGLDHCAPSGSAHAVEKFGQGLGNYLCDLFRNIFIDFKPAWISPDHQHDQREESDLALCIRKTLK